MTYKHIKRYRDDNPKWVFHHIGGERCRSPRKGSTYFGVEIEFERLGSEQPELEAIARELKQKFPWLWVKHDSSLMNGFEVVSHPMTRGFVDEQFHKQEPNFIEWLESRGMVRASETKTGEGGALHVHINRDAFDDDEHIRRFERHLLDAVSGLTNGDGYSKYLFLDMSLIDSAYARYEPNPDWHYARWFAVAVNRSTVEVRCFSDLCDPRDALLVVSIILRKTKENK